MSTRCPVLCRFPERIDTSRRLLTHQSKPMKLFATRHISSIGYLILLTLLTHWPASGQVTLIGDLCPGIQSSLSNFDNAVMVEDYLYFAADDCVNGEELWRTDGTPGGTEMVADIYEGSRSSKPRSITNIDGILFFSANDGKYGKELWTFDPGSGKAEIVTDIYNGSIGSSPSRLIQFQDVLFFFAWSPSFGSELWRSDGTEQGTVMVKDIRPGPYSTGDFEMIVVNDLLFFWGSDGVHGGELWRSDGTENGTEMVRDIRPGSQGSIDSGPLFVTYGIPISEAYKFTKVKDKVFFFANDGTSGAELWTSDGTKAGTFLVKDINPGFAGSYPTHLVYTGDHLLFAATDATTGRELWMINADSFDETLFDINPGTPDSSPLQITHVKDGLVFFSADDGTNGRELWAINGKDDPVLVDDINRGGADSSPNSFFYDYRPNNSSNEGMLLFTANNGLSGFELWASNLNPPFETEMVHEFTAGNVGGSAMEFAKVGSHLVFAHFLGGYGRELWRLDVGNPGNPFIRYNDEDIERDIASPDEVPTVFTLAQNYPNPFNPSTVIHFTLPEAAHVRLSVFDMLGREVHTLVDGNLSAGQHQAMLRADDLPSGTYLYRMETVGFTSTRLMHLTK